jgi:hypothetical protein
VDGTRLGHPVGIDDGSLSSSDVVVVPVPCLGVDRFPDGPDDTKGREVVILYIILTKSS